MSLRHFAVRLIALAFICISGPALAAQGSGCMPTTGTVSGLTFAQDVNAGIAALISSNSGAAAPATDCSGVAVQGQVWLDTSTSPAVLKQYDGSQWLTIGVLDATNHIWTPPVGGGTATLASASTVDLGSVPQAYVSITGSTGPITSFGSSAVIGAMKVLVFASTPTVTYNASSMILPGGADMTAAAGDVWLAAYLGAGNWRVLNAQQASGKPLASAGIGVGDLVWTSAVNVPDNKWVFGYGQALSRASYPDFVTATTIVQSATRTSGSPILTGLSDTSQLGAGMPVEGTGITSGSTISSVDSATQITVSLNASSSGTSNITAFPFGYGSGGGTSTIGVIDCRGAAIAGRDNIGGTARNALTSTYFGTSATRLGAFGGTQSKNLTIANINAFTPTGSVNITDGRSWVARGAATNDGGTTNVATYADTAAGSNFTIEVQASGSISGTFTGNSLGSGTAHSVVQPTVIANCKVRVLP